MAALSYRVVSAAAGLFSYGVHELQELEMFGTWEGDRNHMVSGATVPP